MDPATDTKAETMVLSRLKVKASSAPASSPGAIRGSVIWRKALDGVAPRSAAASSRLSSSPASRARTMSVTTALENTE